MAAADNLARASRILASMISVEEAICYLADDCFLSMVSASRFLDYSDPRMLEKAARRGELPAYRVGKKMLVRKSDLIEFVLARRLPYKSQAEKSALADLVSKAVERARAVTAARKEGSSEPLRRRLPQEGSK